MIITYQHVLTRLNFHFESTNNIIYFKITQREKNKIKALIPLKSIRPERAEAPSPGHRPGYYKRKPVAL